MQGGSKSDEKPLLGTKGAFIRKIINELIIVFHRKLHTVSSHSLVILFLLLFSLSILQYNVLLSLTYNYVYIKRSNEPLNESKDRKETETRRENSEKTSRRSARLR